MVPARNLQLLRDAHGTPFGAAGLGVTTAPSHMAQEPIDRHQEPSKPPPPPPQERQADQEERHGKAEALPLQLAGHQEAAGTSGSSSGGSSGNGDWLRLGLAPASPGAGAGSQAGIFADRAGPLLSQPRTEVLPRMGMPPGSFLRQAVPGIPQASITLPAPRARLPWLPPWSAAAAPPSSLLPFAHRAFYTFGAGAGAGSSGLDTIRVVLPPAAVAAAASVWFVLQAAPRQGREPFLPQIPRSYLRIKDGRVTIRLLIKYLVSKLGLEDESEVEITCRGRPLLPFQTLQHVRDSIWCAGDAVSPSVAPDMSAANHLMILQYGRRPW
ncbi:protein LAX PANICLE 2-like [Phragmites australis]|uniref:protein LAX PANICLE 2-like n=1 Tax=Phragmites australis TaxID=29695 RepID=UPI002D77480E|nr:protein LAX PANICLE 2-like [Phragmites australis]